MVEWKSNSLTNWRQAERSSEVLHNHSAVQLRWDLQMLVRAPYIIWACSSCWCWWMVFWEIWEEMIVTTGDDLEGFCWVRSGKCAGPPAPSMPITHARPGTSVGSDSGSEDLILVSNRVILTRSEWPSKGKPLQTISDQLLSRSCWGCYRQQMFSPPSLEPSPICHKCLQHVGWCYFQTLSNPVECK